MHLHENLLVNIINKITNIGIINFLIISNCLFKCGRDIPFSNETY
jgi:hypothetical protein